MYFLVYIFSKMFDKNVFKVSISVTSSLRTNVCKLLTYKNYSIEVHKYFINSFRKKSFSVIKT